MWVILGGNSLDTLKSYAAHNQTISRPDALIFYTIFDRKHWVQTHVSA
jgi:hypothetical protein